MNDDAAKAAESKPTDEKELTKPETNEAVHPDVQPAAAASEAADEVPVSASVWIYLQLLHSVMSQLVYRCLTFYSLHVVLLYAAIQLFTCF